MFSLIYKRKKLIKLNHLGIKFECSKLNSSIWKNSDHLSPITFIQSKNCFPFNNFFQSREDTYNKIYN